MLTERFGKNFNPLVSIIIPVCNGDNYVREAIDSALAQTYKNIEIIVVNDGSVDNSEEIIKSYGNKLRYFKKENGGVSTALNLGIKKMKGEYFSWLSHDDIYYPNKIKRQIEELSKLEINIRKNIIIMSNFSVINKKSKIVSETHFENDYKLKPTIDSVYPLLLGIVNGCTLLIPKKCFIKVGYFDKELRLTQDYDLWFKIFPNYRLLFIGDPLVKMRVHKGQGTWKIQDINGEYDNLWINAMKKIDDYQKIAMFGSVDNFYKEVYKTINSFGYTNAEKFLLDEVVKYEKKTGLNINIEKKVSITKREKYYLDKLYRLPLFGEILVKVYLKIKKLF